MRTTLFAALIAFFVITACSFAAPLESESDPSQIIATPGPILLIPPTAIASESDTGSQSETASDTDNTENLPDEQPAELLANFIGPNTYPDNVNPLTGLMVDDPAVLQRRPIVAKISNAPPLVRPQAGIGAADLVFEHYAEGGLTRFSAVFYSDMPDRVGSVRSARLVDIELPAMFQALLIFSGGSTGVEELIFGSEAIGIAEARTAEGREIVPPSDFADRAFKGVLYGQPYYWRDESIPVPHNLFANPNAIQELARSNGITSTPSLSGMAFSLDAPSNAAGVANLVDIRYRATRVQWTYDPENGVYRRMSDGQPHSDANTGQQVTAENVVIIYANHVFTDIVESEWQGNKSYSIQVQLWFEGAARVARDGQWYDVRWERPTRESLITLETYDGEVFPLKPGKTWFQLVRLTEQQEEGAEWVNIE